MIGEETPLPLAAVFSVEGDILSHAEKSLFSASQPFGFILFGRNCKTPDQLKKLTESLRSCVGWNCPIMIDQEGGRVARMKSPEWPDFLCARHYGQKLECGEDCPDLDQDMTHLAEMLLANGINVNCAPVCDVLTKKTHDIIGDRAYSSNPEIVSSAALRTAKSFLDAGVTPIIKHLPGHGRANVDSHLTLPIVDASLDELRKTDFVPFSSFAEQKGVWGMVAHIIFSQIDPNLPATLSKTVINDIIRQEIGFQGLLFSDDLDMKALENYGSIAQRANLSLQAGCDLALYCWAKLEIMEQMAADLPPLSAKGWARWHGTL
ncbi:MAG: beta-N-acetylhexosaminidase [Alphaproteobacteria bacterium]|jgi:beta-N-acetylhexosaminidase|nr:beta-N-acetylhexosaminidase [Alphaproteobacteria bacterium]MCB1551271.1 beta-N-acetylhexosaminidase [Alphaproteobacteria bacterium]MCB9984364.1 beta-N-acetylhexosaminidase [Micavibrio sp.]HPQ50262.1 beta-N-acetylhexosaminidase [Alphaproteobacteria bacterium]